MGTGYGHRTMNDGLSVSVEVEFRRGGVTKGNQGRLQSPDAPRTLLNCS